jgi:hypothetical protein
MRPEKRSARSRCARARRLTQKMRELEIYKYERASRFTQIRSIGGSVETLANALSVMPRGSPSRSDVTTVTPDGWRRITVLNAAGSAARAFT